MRSNGKLGAWILIAAMLALLGLAVYVAVSGWQVDDKGGDVSGAGYVAMAFGIVVTLALGIGLMVLIFKSGDGR